MASEITPRMTVEDQRELEENLGISGMTSGEELTMSELRSTVDAETDPEFASMGEAIRSDLTGQLDADLLEAELENIATQLRRLPEVREAGIPDGETEADVLYRELIQPAWRVYDHLAEVGFFESVEENLPRFTPEHIEHTAHELIGADPLIEALEECGFDDHERTVLVMNAVNNNTRLARWVPTREIPDEVGFNVDFVPPLHQRAMGGALLWINAIDTHLWQKRVLVTDEILDDAYWDIKAMLGGLYLMTAGAAAIANREELTDAQVTAALTAGAAVAIVNQEELCKDMFWITEDMRAPSEAR